MRGLRYSCGYYLPNPGINDTIYLEGSPEGICVGEAWIQEDGTRRMWRGLIRIEVESLDSLTPSRHVGDALESPGEIYESLQISRCESRAA
eukprot:753479-Amorphochlora_amoeboformis.AAC.1